MKARGEKTKPSSLDELIKQAQNQQNKFNLLQSEVNPFADFENNYKDQEKENSLKTFYKEFKKVADASDVIIEVLDARDPLGTRCPQVEDLIINSGKNQKLVLLLNKIGITFKKKSKHKVTKFLTIRIIF
jgi:nuclear GTP-binding protein